MNILVIGGTGMVGSHVVRELLDREVQVTVLSRKSKGEANPPKNVHHLQGDLLSPKTVRNMCKKMDAVFLLNTVSPTECHEGLMAVNGIRQSEVSKVVYLSVHHVGRAPYLPHFGAKLPIEGAIKDMGKPYTILRPNNFYQNDYWIKDALLNGVYPYPMGKKGLSRVDIRDIGEAAAISLTNNKSNYETINVVGPDILTGEQTAQIWGRALDKSIFYAGDNLDSWEEQALEQMPAWLVFDIKLMYKFFQEHGLKATEFDIKKLTTLLGHLPRSFEDFAQETAEMWKKEKLAKK